MLFRHTIAALASAASLAAVAPAFAAASSSATLSQFTYTLYDLNPTDGVAPSVSFLPSTSSGNYSLVQVTAVDPALGSQSASNWSLLPLGPSSVTAGIGLSAAQASISGAIDTGGLVLQASGSALGSTVPSAGGSFNAGAQLSSYGSLNFNLSPQTLIVFGGVVNLAAQTTVGLSSGSFQSESTSAGASMSVFGNNAGLQGSQNASDSRSLNASFASVFNPQTGQLNYTGQNVTLANTLLSVGFSNLGPSTLSGQLSVSVSVNGSSQISPVPEPTSTALMLAGAAALGLWARRRPR